MVELIRTLSDAIGIIGVSCILIAYFLINTARVTSTSLPYLTLNFSGAWLILVSLFFHWNLASVIIECAWIMISLLGYYRVFRARRQTNSD
jgi:hypothetical protein